jgi:hypothetical protein
VHQGTHEEGDERLLLVFFDHEKCSKKCSPLRLWVLELKVEGVAAGLHMLLLLPSGDDGTVATEAARRGIYVELLSRFALQHRDPASSSATAAYTRRPWSARSKR